MIIQPILSACGMSTASPDVGKRFAVGYGESQAPEAGSNPAALISISLPRTAGTREQERAFSQRPRGYFPSGYVWQDRATDGGVVNPLSPLNDRRNRLAASRVVCTGSDSLSDRTTRTGADEGRLGILSSACRISRRRPADPAAQDDVSAAEERNTMNQQTCISCGCLTGGSIGAAGLRWPNLCQTCKDAEDAALARHLEQTKRLLEIVREGFSTSDELEGVVS